MVKPSELSWAMIGSASALSTSATLHRAPPVVGISPRAATKAFSSAAPRSVSIPMTSPVDFISGPSAVSTSISLTVENTGALTATSGRAATHHASGQLDHRNTGHLAEEGHRPRRPGIDLEHVGNAAVHRELDVAETADVKGARDADGGVDDEPA